MSADAWLVESEEGGEEKSEGESSSDRPERWTYGVARLTLYYRRRRGR